MCRSAANCTAEHVLGLSPTGVTPVTALANWRLELRSQTWERTVESHAAGSSWQRSNFVDPHICSRIGGFAGGEWGAGRSWHAPSTVNLSG